MARKRLAEQKSWQKKQEKKIKASNYKKKTYTVQATVKSQNEAKVKNTKNKLTTYARRAYQDYLRRLKSYNAPSLFGEEEFAEAAEIVFDRTLWPFQVANVSLTGEDISLFDKRMQRELDKYTRAALSSQGIDARTYRQAIQDQKVLESQGIYASIEDIQSGLYWNEIVSIARQKAVENGYTGDLNDISSIMSFAGVYVYGS